MNKVTLITGATSGIGRSCARTFSQKNHDLIITGRREERLSEIAEELTSKYGINVLPLCFDIRDNNEVIKAVSSIPSEWQNIEILINNAGLAVGLNTLQDGIVDDWDRMIDTNLKGLLYLSRAIIPNMINIFSKRKVDYYLKE